MRLTRLLCLGIVLGTTLTIGLTGAAQPADRNAAASARRRYIVVAKRGADLATLRAEVEQAGALVLRDLEQIGMLVVSAPPIARGKVAASTFAAGIAPDRAVRLVGSLDAGAWLNAAQAGGNFSIHKRVKKADPAFNLNGLLWNIFRIRAPEAWKKTFGSHGIKVGVIDTGLDFTHPELRKRIEDVVDFTDTEDPSQCKLTFGNSDADFAAAFAPGFANADWNGRGTSVGGTIASAIDHHGINGIAPKIRLVSLKVAQWCGLAFNSTIIEAILYAAVHRIDVVNISLVDYLNLSDPDQMVLYNEYLDAALYARAHGTTIVAPAGDDHIRVGDGGRVLTHGSLTTTGNPVRDLSGLYQVPGGIPGVIDVSSTNNLVNAPLFGCPIGSTGTPFDPAGLAVCKPTSDPHQPAGVGMADQLAYYSNYGPRVDVAAPGGARKFNLPSHDRGGTPGFPWTDDDGFNAWEVFSTTSNFTVSQFGLPQGIVCFLIDGDGFVPDRCYSTLEGTAMAAAHASAVVALSSSAQHKLRHKPAGLEEHLRDTARPVPGNQTAPLSASDTSPGDLSTILCFGGFCHLGGPPISDAEAYGAGLVDAKRAVTEKEKKEK